jgi:WD40 repeat protein
MMARVFLSHASGDSDLAVRVQDWLLAGGHEVFLDCDPAGGIPSGGLWRDHLYERLRWASALVCVVTDAYNASQWCFGEVVAAKVVGCRVIPLAGQADVVHTLLEERQHIAIYGAAEPAGRQRLLAYLRDCDIAGAAGWPDDRSPFPGLRPFEPDMHQAFFGRQAETDAVMRLLRSAVERDDRHVLVVVGPSGCGKSSLVRAGVMAAISREAGWAVVPPTAPGAQPLTGLARSFAQSMPGVAGWGASQVRDRLATDGLLDVATDYLTARPGPPVTRLLLVIDQFEEVLTRADATGRQQLASVLAPAVDAGVVRLVTTMRSEFLDPLLASGEFAELPIRSFPLRPLDPRMLHTVIASPMRLAGIRVAPELVDRMVAETDSGESLPLLAYTLQEVTTGMRRGDELTAQRYDTSGGVRGALIRQADAALAEAVAAGGRSDSEVLRTLLRMVTVDETGHTSRRETTYDQFNDAAMAEIDTFVRYRLLTTRTESNDLGVHSDEAVLVAVAHEAFLREWPLLAKMIESHRDALRMRVTFEDAATAWAASGHHRSYLWDRIRLASGIAALGASLRQRPKFYIAPRRTRVTGPMVVDSPIVDLSPRAVEFANQSARRNQQRRRRITMTVAAVLTVSLVLTSIALSQWQTALKQRQAAFEQQERAVAQLHIATARELMAHAEQLRGSDIYQALKLGLAAERIDSNPNTRTSLVTTLTSAMRTATIPDDQYLTAAAFSPDGHTLAITGDLDGSRGTVQLWDVTNRTAPTRTATISDQQGVTAVAFSPDGHTLAAATGDLNAGGGTVQLWDVTNRTAPTRTATISDQQGVTAVAFSPDGHTLAAATDDLTGDFNDDPKGDPDGDLSGDPSGDLTGDPNSDLDLDAGRGTVQLWDVSNRSAPTRTAIISDQQGVTAVAFSPDGGTLAITTSIGISSGDTRGAVQLWDVTRRTAPARTASIPDSQGVTAVAFSPDGRTLAMTTNPDSIGGGTVQLWDVATRTAPTRTATMPDSQGLTAMAFSPDGNTLAAGTTSSYDSGGKLQLWDVTTRTALTRTATVPDYQDVTAVAFSPDGQTLATTTSNPKVGGGSVQLWNASRTAPTRTATLDEWGGTAVAFSPDGHALATTSSGLNGGTLHLWDVTSRTAPARTATIPSEWVSSVVFSPDGHTLATTSDSTGDGGPVQLWDVTTRTPTATINQRVSAVAFSPDGHTLAVTTSDSTGVGGSVQLWDVTTRTAPTRTATIPDNQHVTAVAFSLDGHTLAITTTSSSTDAGGSVQLWDVTTRTAPNRTATVPLSQYVSAVVFSPDGHTLATIVTNDPYLMAGTVQLWDVTTSTAPARIATISDEPGVTAVVFSPDGRTLAATTSGLGGGTVQLWDVTTRTAPTRTATVPENQYVSTVAFSPDGRTLATTTTNNPSSIHGSGKVQLWDVEWITSLSGNIHSWACSAAGGGLTADEWSRLVPNVSFRQSC